MLADPEGEHRSFRSLLQIREELLEPWSDDHSGTLTERELLDAMGVDDRQPIDALVGYGLLEPADGGRRLPTCPAWTPSTGPADAPGGGCTPTSGRGLGAMQRRLGGLADDLVAIFVAHAGYGLPDASTPGEAAAALGQLRPIALRAVQVAFAHEIERAIGAELEQAASPPDPSADGGPTGGDGRGTDPGTSTAAGR